MKLIQNKHNIMLLDLFELWLLKGGKDPSKKYASSTIKCYADTIFSLDKRLLNDGLIQHSLFTMRSLEFDNTIERVMKDPKLSSDDENGKRRLSNALHRYSEFLRELQDMLLELLLDRGFHKGVSFPTFVRKLIPVIVIPELPEGMNINTGCVDPDIIIVVLNSEGLNLPKIDLSKAVPLESLNTDDLIGLIERVLKLINHPEFVEIRLYLQLYLAYLIYLLMMKILSSLLYQDSSFNLFSSDLKSSDLLY